VKTMVKSDESGTYVIVADPKKSLMVHDKAGKMLFDGEIETDDQRAALEKIAARQRRGRLRRHLRSSAIIREASRIAFMTRG